MAALRPVEHQPRGPRPQVSHDAGRRHHHQAPRRHAGRRVHPAGRVLHRPGVRSAREMERLFAREWICAGRSEQAAAPGQYLPSRDSRARASSSRALRQARSRRSTTSAAIAAPGCARSTRAVRRQHPVPVSRLDLRPRRPAGRRAAHGRRAALRQGRLSRCIAWPRTSGTATSSSRWPRSRRRSPRSSPTCRPSSPPGGCRISASATASSTTCAPTGS